MTEPTAIGDLDLAALVSSRICHDVINPVGAIANGLEMLGEEPDQAMRDAAIDLIRKSALQASAKLQFARLAFGAAGSAGAEIDLRDAEKVSRDFVQGSRSTGSLARARRDAAEEQGQAPAQPRGARRGRAPARRDGERRRSSASRRMSVSRSGQGRCGQLNDQVRSLLLGGNGVAVDAHSIQPYYASRVAAASGMSVTAEAHDGEVELKAA